MIKKIIITLAVFTSILICNDVKAASGNITVKSSTSNAIVGKNITVNVTVSSTSTIGSWDATLSYDTSKLRLTNSTATGQRMVGYGDGKTKSQNYTFTFTTIASGKANIYVSAARIVDYDTVAELSVNKGSTSVNIKTQAEIEASYSKNNYLSSLGIEGKELVPIFNKDTLEYTVEMEPEITKVIINANKEDSKATITGNGEREVVDGDNKLEIVVTAENGNVRKYVINVKVKEHNPIEVTIGDKKYTVIRKKSALKGPNNYTETTVKINEEDVPAFISEITKYTLVGLKDEQGIIQLYIYDGKEYKKYEELSFNKITIYPMSIKNIPKNYKKTKIKYNEIDVVAYKINEKSNYALIYGMNIETGAINLYLYDSTEHTMQIYNDEEIKLLEKQNDLYFKIIIVIIIIAVIILGLFIIMLSKNNRKHVIKNNTSEIKEKHRKKHKEKRKEKIEEKETPL